MFYISLKINTPSLFIHMSNEIGCPDTISLYSQNKIFHMDKTITLLNDLIFRSQFVGRFIHGEHPPLPRVLRGKSVLQEPRALSGGR